MEIAQLRKQITKGKYFRPNILSTFHLETLTSDPVTPTLVLIYITAWWHLIGKITTVCEITFLTYWHWLLTHWLCLLTYWPWHLAPLLPNKLQYRTQTDKQPMIFLNNFKYKLRRCSKIVNNADKSSRWALNLWNNGLWHNDNAYLAKHYVFPTLGETEFYITTVITCNTNVYLFHEGHVY